MKTQKEKIAEKITELEKEIKNAEKDRQKHYDSLKDFKLSDNKTKIVLDRMKDLNSLIKACKNKITKLQQKKF